MKLDWELILKYLDNESSPEDLKRIEDLRKTDPEFDKEIKLMEKVRQIPAQNLPAPDVEAALSNVKNKISLAESDDSEQPNIYKLDLQPKKTPFEKPFNRYIFRAAALFVIFLTGVYLVSQFFSGSGMNSVLVSNAAYETVTLPDGTKIQLDAGSSFRYPAQFETGIREVYLNGEAYFTVTPDPENPFVIHANNATVTVLGTAFSLRAWESYNKTTIAVVEGKVSFKTKNESQNEEVILTKGEMSVIEGDNPPVAPRQTEISQHTAWLNREINFQSTPLSEVLDQLSRWYDLEFVLPADSYGLDLLNVYIKNEPVENILDVICIMMNFTYQRDGNRIVFSY